MFIAFNRQRDMSQSIGRTILPGDPGQLECARSQHARLLQTAAARRLRSLERSGLGRGEDAQYWKQCAPVALRKAAELRCSGLPRLP